MTGPLEEIDGNYMAWKAQEDFEQYIESEDENDSGQDQCVSE